MIYYVLNPEVAGGAGRNTVFIDPRARPTLVESLNYEFHGWLGDPILETVCHYVVTVRVKERLENLMVSGALFAPVEVSKSGEFLDSCPGVNLPDFVWLQVNGEAGIDDFGYLSGANRVAVSERVLDLLLEEGMKHCLFTEIENWRGWKQSALRRKK